MGGPNIERTLGWCGVCWGWCGGSVSVVGSGRRGMDGIQMDGRTDGGRADGEADGGTVDGRTDVWIVGRADGRMDFIVCRTST